MNKQIKIFQRKKLYSSQEPETHAIAELRWVPTKDAIASPKVRTECRLTFILDKDDPILTYEKKKHGTLLCKKCREEMVIERLRERQRRMASEAIKPDGRPFQS